MERVTGQSESLADMVRRRHEPRPGESCRACGGSGEWFTECCSGAGGCSCRGDIVSMGRCRVCDGRGVEPEGADPAANLATIEGYGFIGSGPSSSGFYDNVPRMGRQV